MNNSVKSALTLDKLVFDTIEFQRTGFSSEKEFVFDILADISQKQGEDVYKVTLTLKGKKPDEYALEIRLSGFFLFNAENDIPEDLKLKLINKNTIAIMMPYLRSEVSLLTAQPNMECVVLPAFNINNMLEK